MERMVDSAPIAWRCAADAIYMVGSSASPVGEDCVDVEVRVRSGAHVAIRSVAASVAWSGTDTRHRLDVVVESGASLDYEPEPIIATRSCHHTQISTVRLAPGASLRWREVVVRGRHREASGWLRSTLRVDTQEGPLLRHDLTSGTPTSDSPAVLGRSKAVGLLLLTGPLVAAPPGPGPVTDRVVDGGTPPDVDCVTTSLEAGGILVSAAGFSPSGVVAALDRAGRPLWPRPRRPEPTMMTR